jgi:hypothetical protein|tara:strand:+ start:2330 stop:2629 length:300 start_codon:yes stop_codon:yes gene_type:complete
MMTSATLAHVQNAPLSATKMRRVCSCGEPLKHFQSKSQPFKLLGITLSPLNGLLVVQAAYTDLRGFGTSPIEEILTEDARMFTEHGDSTFLSLKQVQVS